MTKADRAALVAHLVRRLAEVGSRASSTHVKNCVFLLQEEHDVVLGYAFVMHHYGPFSFELDADLAAFRREGVLRVTPNGGGVRYGPGPSAPELPAHLASAREAIEAVAQTYGRMATQDLDVRATTFFVKKRLMGAKQEEVIEQVQRIKPHAAVDAVQRALGDFAAR